MQRLLVGGVLHQEFNSEIETFFWVQTKNSNNKQKSKEKQKITWKWERISSERRWKIQRKRGEREREIERDRERRRLSSMGLWERDVNGNGLYKNERKWVVIKTGLGFVWIWAHKVTGTAFLASNFRSWNLWSFFFAFCPSVYRFIAVVPFTP